MAYWSIGIIFSDYWTKVKAVANEETLLRTQMFPRLPAHATFVADANLKKFENIWSFRNILRPQQMFPRLHGSPKHLRPQQGFRNNVSSFATALNYM